MATQAEAIRRFADGDEGGWYARLRELAAPTFVANGDHDGLFPAIDSAVLAREIPHSQLGIYRDSGHAFLFQYAEGFADDAHQRILAGSGFARRVHDETAVTDTIVQ